MLAVKRLAAAAAHPNLGITPAVHEHNGLLPSRNTFRQGLPQLRRHEDALLLPNLTHVNNLYIGQGRRRGPLFQGKQLQVALVCIVESLQSRRGRPEHHQGPVLVGQVKGQFPRVVAGSRVLLLEGTVVFLVQHNHIKVEGRKDGAPGPENHTGLPLQHGHIGRALLWSRKGGMQHLHGHA